MNKVIDYLLSHFYRVALACAAIGIVGAVKSSYAKTIAATHHWTAVAIVGGVLLAACFGVLVVTGGSAKTKD